MIWGSTQTWAAAGDVTVSCNMSSRKSYLTGETCDILDLYLLHLDSDYFSHIVCVFSSININISKHYYYTILIKLSVL